MDHGPDLLSLARERFAVRDYHGAALLLVSLTRQGTLYADAYNLLGLAFALIGRTEEALGGFDEALRLNPRYIEAHLNRSVVLNRLGREREAQGSMAKAAELGATDESGFPAVIANRLANAHAALADDYRAAGALDRAIEEYRRALDLRPLFYDIRLNLGRALLEHGRANEAIDVLDDVLRRRPGWLDAMLLRGLAAYLAGDLDAAGRVWDDAIARYPEEPRLEIYRSMLARRRNELRPA